ncbi:MAG: RNA polymerase subunit sigma-70 [Rhodobacteraceae bacterium]|nr:RNA polymerase subunit sigma-70 [Paracoccaceae bacterium]
MTAIDASRAAERAARDSYGRLVATLAARTRNLAAAEDAVAEAFRAALETWPRTGVPASPEAWLIVTARRVHGHAQAREGTATRAEPEVIRAIQELADMPARDLPDDRLGLLLACADPRVDTAVRTPLMLQAVLGLTADRIGAAFLVSPAAMGQRLSRAKAALRDSTGGFAPGTLDQWPDRAEAVLEAIYAAFGAGLDSAHGTEDGPDLRSEAIWLAEALAAVLPDDPEVLGLLALMLHAQARASARRAGGAYVPLDVQDPALWDAAMADRADAALRRASLAGRFGRFQCEAAIQSVHAERRITGQVNRAALVTLYAALAQMRPTVGVAVARAAALLGAGDAPAALAVLDALPAGQVTAHQPWWATRAHVLAALGDPAAGDALIRAIGLTADPAVRAWLSARPIRPPPR